MIRRIRKILFLLALASCWMMSLSAQTKIQVVNRSINRVFTYTAATSIRVNGEKAQIKVRPSASKQIKVIITLIAKNPSKQDAETDLNFCNYSLSESNGKISIANTFDVKKGYKEISSNLSARIELEIPGELALTLRNIYGSIDLKDVQASWNIINDFGQLTFQNVMGTMHIGTKYGDISGSQLDAITSIDADKSDIHIMSIHKMLRIKNQYGTIALEGVKAPIAIDGNMTSINLSGVDFNACSFDVTVVKGKIEIPKEYQSFLTNKPSEINFKLTQGTVSIKIKTAYNTVTLK